MDGETGWLRPVDEPLAWTKIMRSVLWELDDERLQQMGAKGIERVESHFSSRKMAEDLEDVVQGLILMPKRNGNREWLLLMGLLQVSLFVLMRAIIWGYRSWLDITPKK